MTVSGYVWQRQFYWYKMISRYAMEWLKCNYHLSNMDTTICTKDILEAPTTKWYWQQRDIHRAYFKSSDIWVISSHLRSLYLGFTHHIGQLAHVWVDNAWCFLIHFLKCKLVLGIMLHQHENKTGESGLCSLNLNDFLIFNGFNINFNCHTLQ